MLTENLPAHLPKRNRFWTPELREIARQRYIEQGESSVSVGAAIGCSDAEIRRVASREGWVRDPAVSKRNQLAANKARWAHIERPVIEFKPRREPAPPRPVVEISTLGDRVLVELSSRPLCVVSMASILGVNEQAVSLQLSFLAHEGRVEAGTVGDRGLRYRVWSVVDQSSAVAQIAASLRCGPDSLVVAGEAA